MKYYAEFELPGTDDKFSGVIDLSLKQPNIPDMEAMLAKTFDVDEVKLLSLDQLH